MAPLLSRLCRPNHLQHSFRNIIVGQYSSPSWINRAGDGSEAHQSRLQTHGLVLRHVSPAIVKWKDQWKNDLWPHRTAHCRSGATKQQGGVIGNARRTIDPPDGGIDPSNRPHVGSGDRSAGTGGADGSGRELVVVNRKTFGAMLVSLSLSPRFSSPSGTDEIDGKERRDQTDDALAAILVEVEDFGEGLMHASHECR